MLTAVPRNPARPEIVSTAEIIEEIRRGNMVVLVDDEDRENEGDLLFAADFVSAEKINFMAKHARGLVCLTLTQAQADRLKLPPMTQANGTVHHTNFTVSIEAADGVTTGISAADRAPCRSPRVPTHALATSCSPATSSRWWPSLVACSCAPAIPRRAAT
jgi:3,4-dihydroxy 2-butanone 4-phosphate synthase/GTP cyclohydrolase II